MTAKPLLLGTSNSGKVADWRAMLGHLALEILDPAQLGLTVDAVESAETAEENARIKALAYCAASGIPTFSLDAALRIEGLPAERQPGVHVRRIGGAESATDAEMVDHYRALLEKLGGRAAGEWILGIALAPDRHHVYSERMTNRTTFVSTPSPMRVTGNPLRSLQIDPATGEYFAEMTPAEHAIRLAERSRRIVRFITRYLPGAVGCS